MAISKIKDMVDSYPDTINGINSQISGISKQIAEYQSQQDALQQVLEQIYGEVVTDFLVPSCDFLYKGQDFYSGIGIGTIDSNIENWQAYSLVSDPVIGQQYYDVTVSPPELKAYDETFDAYSQITVDDSSVQDKYDEFSTTVDYIHHPLGTTGMYGTEGNIANLQNAVQSLTANKQKFTECQQKLSRFGED